MAKPATAKGSPTDFDMSTQNDISIVFSETAGPSGQVVRERLDMFQHRRDRCIDLLSRALSREDRARETRGGLTGGIWGGRLHIGFLTIDEALRGQDRGTRLMDQARPTPASAAAT